MGLGNGRVISFCLSEGRLFEAEDGVLCDFPDVKALLTSLRVDESRVALLAERSRA